VFLFVAIVAILVGSAIALSLGWVRPPWEPAPRVGSLFEGTGSLQSADFRLQGDYDVEWTLGPIARSCSIRIELRSPNRPNASELLAIGTGVTHQSSGTRALTSVSDDAYYVAVDGPGCGWQVRFVPRDQP
jgi:hypothetical protein